MRGKLPPLPPGTPGRPKDNRYREQYGVIVICKHAREQEDVFKALVALSREPLKVRLVVT
jgi:hypothetical protein